MYADIKKHFEELAIEFMAIQEKISHDQSLLLMQKLGAYPNTGSTRYGNGYTIESGISLKADILAQYLRKYTRNFRSSRQIYDAFVTSNLWGFKVYEFEQDFHSMPSISNNIISRFLIRNFEYNENQFVCTESSINKSFSELAAFLDRDYFEYKSIMSLHGPSGSLKKMSLSDEVIIRKADNETVRQFGLFYSDFGENYIEMFESDYVLEINFKIQKDKYFQHVNIENSMFKKWFHAVLLLKPGNIERGKRLRISSDWPLIQTIAIYNLWSLPNPYNTHYKSDFSFVEDDQKRLLSISELISKIDMDKMDDRLKHSIERLIKAKACRDINDRVIELALALEYLINTASYEVTLQLSLKPIKLLSDDNKDETLYKLIKAFYGLRSTVVHGIKKLNSDPKTIETINSMEQTIQNMTLRMIDLNQKYSVEKVNKALDKSLYVSAPLIDILDGLK